LAVSTASIFIRYAQEDVPSLVIAAYRLTLATFALAPVALSRHRSEILALGVKDLLLALLSGVFLAAHFATWISSLEYTSVASSVVFVTTTPLWVAIFSPLVLKEYPSRSVLAGMVLALGGSVLVGLSDTCELSAASFQCPPVKEFIGGDAFFGDILALSGAIAAGAYVLIGRRLRGGMSLVGYIFLVYGMAALVLISIVVIGGFNLFVYPSRAYFWLILLALVPQLVGHSMFNWALRHLSAAYVSLTLLGEPIGATILAYIFLGEQPTMLKIFGAILILLGIYWASNMKISVASKAK
jgi:drug/metabolite transporter (DMT)-like permease